MNIQRIIFIDFNLYTTGDILKGLLTGEPFFGFGMIKHNLLILFSLLNISGFHQNVAPAGCKLISLNIVKVFLFPHPIVIFRTIWRAAIDIFRWEPRKLLFLNMSLVSLIVVNYDIFSCHRINILDRVNFNLKEWCFAILFLLDDLRCWQTLLNKMNFYKVLRIFFRRTEFIVLFAEKIVV